MMTDMYHGVTRLIIEKLMHSLVSHHVNYYNVYKYLTSGVQ
jgi:hypothetical protein